MTDIIVHGRSLLKLPYTRYQTINGSESQVDLSSFVMMFECQAAKISVGLNLDPLDAMGRLIELTAAQVALIPMKGAQFVVYEISQGATTVEWSGIITRTGFSGEPLA